jgi:hypothetical protein
VDVPLEPMLEVIEASVVLGFVRLARGEAGRDGGS